jgi:hypothetical protein
MPVETAPPITPPNVAYISDLNSDWPTGADFPSDGDDHIRGVKNVLKQTFPNLTGPVTLTQDEINSGSKMLEKGTVCLFYQAAAPTGWTRVNPTVGNRMLIVTSGGAGVEAGDDDPIFNDKVPSHTHPTTASLGGASSTTTGAAGSHTHSMNATGNHSHVYTGRGGGGVGGYGGGCCLNPLDVATSAAGLHAHTIYAVGNHSHSINHTHSLSVGVSANAGAANWAPRYSACLLAKRD